MRAPRIAASLIAAGVAVAGLAAASPASASLQPVTCASTVAQFRAEHHRIWIEAGSPLYVCQSVGTIGEAGFWDGSAIHISPQGTRTDFGTPADYYREVIAHETGHAWAARRSGITFLDQYRAVRGFGDQASAGTLREDYAETFAYTLGWWDGWNGQILAPYAFRAGAGFPTSQQIARLRALAILPKG